MALQIVQKEWSDIMLYIRDKLRTQMGMDRTLSEETILGTLAKCTLETYLADTEQKKERKKPQVTDDKGFEVFWQEYPSSANFSYRGMQFKSSRVLKANKQICQMLYLRGLQENNVSAEQVLEALRKQIKLVKEESYESGQNRMQYQPACEVWLRQQVYMSLIGMEVEEEYNDHGSNCA